MDMQRVPNQFKKTIEELAARYGFSEEAVLTMFEALVAGQGTMAQFDHPEFGGMGQWTRGGMIMVGDMFNHALKAKINQLCSELADVLSKQPTWIGRESTSSQMQWQGESGAFRKSTLFDWATGDLSGNWWGADLGTPASIGSQNNIRYAYFPASRRLAVAKDDQVTIYDTQDHHIGGVSQQQSSEATLTFVSQHGLVRLADLPVVSTRRGESTQPHSGMPAAKEVKQPEAPPPSPEQERNEKGPSVPLQASPVHGSEVKPGEDVFFKIERLAELRDKGLISEQEFAAKKTELLSRL
jgi:hypothetical protein